MRFAWKLRALEPKPFDIKAVPEGNGLQLSGESEATLEEFR
jgi:hypothetical protein